VSVRKYPGGHRILQIQFQYRGVTCKEVLRGHDPDKNQDRRYANNIKAQIEYLKARGTFVYTDFFPQSDKARAFGFAVSQQTVAQAQEALIADLETAGRARTTIAAYRRSAARNNAWLGDIRVVDLKPEHIRDMIRGRPVSRKMWANDLLPLRRALRRQVNDGVLNFSPLDRVVIDELVPKAEKPLPDPFTQAEMELIIEAARVYCERSWNLIEFAFFTGLRIEELAGLRWEDLKEGQVEVKRATMLSMYTAATKEPKTAASARIVNLLPRAQDALRRQLPITRWRKEQVFCRLASPGPIAAYKHISRRWRTILKRAGVRYRSFKHTRHTYITHMLGSGENPLYVAAQSGHRGTNMQDVYARWVEAWKDDYDGGFGAQKTA
jgi:integrase